MKGHGLKFLKCGHIPAKADNEQQHQWADTKLKAVIEAARKGKVHRLLFLPPYSPNLNIIERMWKFTKKQILYAKYYDKPEAFHQAIESFFANINKNCKKQLTSLLTLNFQFFDDQNSLIYPL